MFNWETIWSVLCLYLEIIIEEKAWFQKKLLKGGMNKFRVYGVKYYRESYIFLSDSGFASYDVGLLLILAPSKFPSAYKSLAGLAFWCAMKID